MTTAAAIKTAVWLAVALAATGCTIGRLHATLVDMNKVKSSSFEEAPPKPAAQVNIQWDF